MSGLTGQQRRMASFLIGFGIMHGLSPQHAREFAAAAYAESGLDPARDNSSSGAAGLFQLLSSGYVRRANALGGVHNARANAGAIIDAYKRYWAGHPGARPGEAGRDVEISGEGAGFYAGPLALLGGVQGGASAPAGGFGGGAAPSAGVGGRQINAQALLAAFTPKGGISTSGLLKALAPPPASQATPTAEPVSLPAPSTLSGAKEMLAAIRQARAMGLHVGENPAAGGVDYGAHAPHSYHKLVFPGTQIGRAIDVSSPDPAKMQSYYAWVKANLRTAELLLEGTGGPTHSTGPHVHVAI